MPGEKTDLEGKAISSEKIAEHYSFNSSSNRGNGVVRRIVVNNSYNSMDTNDKTPTESSCSTEQWQSQTAGSPESPTGDSNVGTRQFASSRTINGLKHSRSNGSHHRVSFAETNTVKVVDMSDSVIRHIGEGDLSSGDDADPMVVDNQQAKSAQPAKSIPISFSGIPSASTKPQPILRLPRSPSTESHENPFGETGELSKKADYIVRNSTISRTEIRIADPDATPEPDEACEEPMLSASAAPVSAASPKNAAGDSLAGAKENGKVDEPLSPQNVEVKVADASLPPEGEAEAVKVPKDKKCKCCVLQ